jgi:hypothetical protein
MTSLLLIQQTEKRISSLPLGYWFLVNTQPYETQKSPNLNIQNSVLCTYTIFTRLLSSLNSTVLLLGFFSIFLILYTVGRTTWMGDQPVTRPVTTHRITQTQNERKQKSVLPVGFKPTIWLLEGAKTVHASDRTTTVSGETSTIVKIKNR